MSTSYRNNQNSASKIQNSSSDGEISDNSGNSDSGDDVWAKKRTKINTSGDFTSQKNFVHSSQPTIKPKRSKNANIWGSVLTQQNSDDISSSLGAVGMQHHISRGPESFDLPSNISLPKLRHSDSSDSSDAEPEIKTSVEKLKSKGSKGKRKRKKPKNKNNVPTFKPGQPVILNRRCDISDSDPADKVAEEISFRLWERKKDLIRSLTEVLSVPVAIDLCNKTEEIEKSGGLLITNGIRRRTPGGTFLYLIRNDPKLDQEPIRNIFAMEAERERLQWETRKQTKSKTENNCEMTEVVDNCEEKHTNGDSVSQIPQTDQNLQCSNPKSESVQKEELSEGEIMESDDEKT